jgi:hypothetical protein
LREKLESLAEIPIDSTLPIFDDLGVGFRKVRFHFKQILASAAAESRITSILSETNCKNQNI